MYQYCCYIQGGIVILHSEDLRVIAFPHAGGGKLFYREFEKSFKHFKFLIVQYPGREEKYGKDLPGTIGELADELFEEYKEWFRNDYVVWGHSMGSTVGYEVVKRCEEILNNSPIVFFSSGASAPCDPSSSKVKLSLDSDEDFEELMDLYGGISDELRQNKDFCEYFYPIIRGDMRMLTDYRDDERIKMRCPIRLLEGNKDDCVIDKWKFYTDFDINVKYHDGGHFFINDYKQEIANYIEKATIEIKKKNSNLRLQ